MNIVPYTVLAACVLAAAAPAAAAQSGEHTWWMITDRGNIFEIEPATKKPTTDVVSSPYIEFQRVGGLVVNGINVREAGQYNTVSNSHDTYIISNWGDGDIYGIPNGAPLEGEMLMSPKPHLGLRVPTDTNPPNKVYWPDGISHMEVMKGRITHTIKNETVNGVDVEHHVFTSYGHGRAVIWLNAGSFYAINMVCPDCTDNTIAVLGAVKDSGGSPDANKWGTRTLMTNVSKTCTINSVTHDGCGETPANGTITSIWPLDPRPDIEFIDDDADKPDPVQIPAVLNVTRFDTATCPGANHTNTRIDYLNDTMFQVVSGGQNGCVMKNYSYEWWDGVIHLDDWLPLRAGLTIWERPSGYHPAIVLNMVGGEIKLQVHTAPTEAHAEQALAGGSLSIDPGHAVGTNSIAILHDSYAHLGAYRQSNLDGIKDKILTYPQAQVNNTVVRTAHSSSSGPDSFGGLLGDDCLEGYKYCLTVFDSDRLPVISNAKGVVYDPRNNVALNRGGDVYNHGSVFKTAPTRPFELEYDDTKLTIIQAYAVIPVTGTVDVRELYLTAHQTLGCDHYVDKLTTPHSWRASSAPGWLQLSYLEIVYSGDNTNINVPLLPWYDTVCMRTEGANEFRQFSLDNFFVVGGNAASFGGSKHIAEYDVRTISTLPDRTQFVLDTDVVLPGEGVRVLDLDMNVDVSVITTGYREGGGGAHVTNNMRMSCDWKDHFPSRNVPARGTSNSPPPKALAQVEVMLDVPAVGGWKNIRYTMGGNTYFHTVELDAASSTLPITVGDDCMEQTAVTWNFKPVFETIPLEYSSNTPIGVSVKTNVWFYNTGQGWYGGGLLDSEKLYVETFIDRLALGVN